MSHHMTDPCQHCSAIPRRRPGMSDSDSSSLSSVEDEIKPKPPAAKKAAATGGANSKQQAKAGDKRKRPANSDNEDPDEKRVTIGNRRFVSLSNFHGRFFVDIREFYEDKSSGELKPGKKGIALTLEQWDNLKRKIDAVDKLIKDA